jgi:hypothetical protein
MKTNSLMGLSDFLVNFISREFVWLYLPDVYVYMCTFFIVCLCLFDVVRCEVSSYYFYFEFVYCCLFDVIVVVCVYIKSMSCGFCVKTLPS